MHPSSRPADRLTFSHLFLSLRGSSERLAKQIDRSLSPYLREGESMPDVRLLLDLGMRMLQARADETSLTQVGVPLSPVEPDEEQNELRSLIEQTLGEEWASWIVPRKAAKPAGGSPDPEEVLHAMRMALLRWGGEREEAEQLERARRATTP